MKDSDRACAYKDGRCTGGVVCHVLETTHVLALCCGRDRQTTLLRAVLRLLRSLPWSEAQMCGPLQKALQSVQTYRHGHQGPAHHRALTLCTPRHCRYRCHGLPCAQAVHGKLSKNNRGIASVYAQSIMDEVLYSLLADARVASVAKNASALLSHWRQLMGFDAPPAAQPVMMKLHGAGAQQSLAKQLDGPAAASKQQHISLASVADPGVCVCTLLCVSNAQLILKCANWAAFQACRVRSTPPQNANCPCAVCQILVLVCSPRRC